MMTRIPSLGEIKAERARRSLAEYIKQAWPLVEPGQPYVHGWHIDAICEHLEAVTNGQIQNLCINMPPRHMKSLTVSVFWPSWEWLHRPSNKFLYSSYSQSLSTRDSVSCRRLLESSWYRQNWGDVFKLTSDQNVKTRFENDHRGLRLATSVGGSNTGEGGDRIVVDDPNDILDAYRPNALESTVIWWKEVMAMRLNNPSTGARVIVMQRIHELDLSGYVLEQGDWVHLCLPAKYEGEKHYTAIGWEDPREEVDELLWPERYPEKEIDSMERGLGPHAAAGQLQQRPTRLEGSILLRKWWKYYRALPSRFDEVIVSWDMSFKEAVDASYVCGQVWGRKGADKFLLDLVRDKMDFPTSKRAVENLHAAWPYARPTLIEDKANGTAIIAVLKHEIPGIIGVEPLGSKLARVHAVAPDIEAGNVFLPDPMVFHRHAQWVAAFVEECAACPNGPFMDQVDTMSQALARFIVARVRHGPATSPLGVSGVSKWPGR